MTPLELIDALKEELEEMFEEWRYKCQKGTLVPINVYEQNLPKLEVDYSENEEPVPYIIIRLVKGTDSGEKDSFYTVSVCLIVAVWDGDSDTQGYRDVQNIFDKIYLRFHKNPNLRNKAAYTGEWNWVAQEDNYYPYFIAACNLDFRIAAVRKEDKYA